MKKILSFFGLSLLFILSSCTNEDLKPIENINGNWILVGGSAAPGTAINDIITWDFDDSTHRLTVSLPLALGDNIINPVIPKINAGKYDYFFTTDGTKTYLYIHQGDAYYPPLIVSKLTDTIFTVQNQDIDGFTYTFNKLIIQCADCAFPNPFATSNTNRYPVSVSMKAKPLK